MARIIKRGGPKMEIAEFECDTCDSVVAFDRSDIKGDQRDGNYVICPACGAFISESLLDWTKAKRIGWR